MYFRPDVQRRASGADNLINIGRFLAADNAG